MKENVHAYDHDKLRDSGRPVLSIKATHTGLRAETEGLCSRKCTRAEGVYEVQRGTIKDFTKFKELGVPQQWSKADEAVKTLAKRPGGSIQGEAGSGEQREGERPTLSGNQHAELDKGSGYCPGGL